MEFSKLQATGNDFILVNAIGKEADWSSLAREMCDRHFGIGADGLIIVMAASNADFTMKIFNADGSEAEICGNGLRCFTKYVLDGKLASGTAVTVSTLAGIKTIETKKENGLVTFARVNMGRPRFSAGDIPVILPEGSVSENDNGKTGIIDYMLALPGTDITVSLVSMGNPHAVAFTGENIATYPLSDIGPEVEHHGIFPQRANFEIARVVNAGKIEARVWERGVGETLACGSGACAIAVAAQLKGLAGNEVDIMLPGGTLTIQWDGAGDIYLSGPVEEVFTGIWRK